MSKQIEELTDDDLEALWPVIGGAPHLFEYGKDELRKVLITGECANEDDEPIGLQLDYYTMTAIVNTLHDRGFDTPSATEEALFPTKFVSPDNDDICWYIGSETFTRKEVAYILHTQREMIGNDLKYGDCGNHLTDEMYKILDNPRTPDF